MVLVFLHVMPVVVMASSNSLADLVKGVGMDGTNAATAPAVVVLARKSWVNAANVQGRDAGHALPVIVRHEQVWHDPFVVLVAGR